MLRNREFKLPLMNLLTTAYNAIGIAIYEKDTGSEGISHDAGTVGGADVLAMKVT